MSYRQISRAVWELLVYMVDTFTSLLSGVIMVVNVWLSGISGCIVLDLRYIYLASLAAGATTILFVGSWYHVHEQMLRDIHIFRGANQLHAVFRYFLERLLSLEPVCSWFHHGRKVFCCFIEFVNHTVVQLRYIVDCSVIHCRIHRWLRMVGRLRSRRKDLVSPFLVERNL